MQLKTPKFWAKKNLLSCALLPLSLIYFLGFVVLNFLRKTQKISKPVICVGNLIAGGSGKTPTAIALGKILKEIAPPDFQFAYLSSGYKGSGLKFLALGKGENSAQDVGDEAILLSKIAPTFVAKNRLFGARKIENIEEIKALILDDGMQNNALQKDLTIAVVDGQIGFGNGFLIPAGPMRESLKSGFSKADFVVVINDLSPDVEQKLRGQKFTKARLLPSNLEEFSDAKLLAFCGLAYPQKFFSFLKSCNLEVAECREFSDHFSYRDEDLNSLLQDAQSKGLRLITTKKDWVKFSPDFQNKINYLDVELEFLDKNFVCEYLKKLIAPVSHKNH